jgi:hypothetical protein
VVAPVVVLACASAVGLSFVATPKRASALPTFAQAYQVDCSLCHTMVPALNAYGRYVQSTAFGALDAATIMRVAPIVVREAVSYRSTGKLEGRQPADKYTYGNLSINAVGLLSKNFSYRAEQTLLSNNLGGGNTGHLWAAWNTPFHGDGHVIVGKFDAPAPPAFSYWQDQSGFSGGSIGVGQHGYSLAGTRYGIAFNYVPQNYAKAPLSIHLAYVGNSPSLSLGSAFSGANPYQRGAAGSDRAFEYRASFTRPDKPFEAGVYGAVGSYVLANGFTNPIDAYSATGVYAQRDPVKNAPGFFAYYQVSSDGNVGPGVAKQNLTQSAVGHAFALEIDESILNGDVMLGLRPVEYVGGLQASKNGPDVLTTAKPHYGVVDLVGRDPKFSPYLYMTLEAALGGASNATYAQPAWRAGFKYAGPLFPAPRLAAQPAAPPAAAASAVPASAPVPAVSASPAAASPAASTVPTAP